MRGPKKSEITTVRALLAETGLEKAQVTLDALHFTPATTRQINLAGGHLILQLKDNQPLLLDHLSPEAATAVAVGRWKTAEQGHGRREQRQAAFFPACRSGLGPRWDQSGLATLIVMARRTPHLATGKRTAEISFYCTNVEVEEHDSRGQQALFQAIRAHGRVETPNYIRDVTFQEDPVRTTNTTQAHVLATLRTLAIHLLQEAGVPNFKAALETFADCPDLLADFLLQQGFL